MFGINKVREQHDHVPVYRPFCKHTCQHPSQCTAVPVFTHAIQQLIINTNPPFSSAPSCTRLCLYRTGSFFACRTVGSCQPPPHNKRQIFLVNLLSLKLVGFAGIAENHSLSNLPVSCHFQHFHSRASYQWRSKGRQRGGQAPPIIPKIGFEYDAKVSQGTT